MKIVSKRSRKTLRKSRRKTLRKTKRKTLRKSRRQQRGGLFKKQRKSKSEAFCKNDRDECLANLKDENTKTVTIQCENKDKTTITKTTASGWSGPEWNEKFSDAWILGKGKCNCGLNACNN